MVVLYENIYDRCYNNRPISDLEHQGQQVHQVQQEPPEHNKK